MSALGQKPTYAVQKGMSALPPIATMKAEIRKRSCLLYPRKRRRTRSCLLWANSGHRQVSIARSNSGIIDDFCPLRRFRFDGSRKFRRRAGNNIHANIAEPLAHVWLGKDRDRVLMNLFDDCGRRSRRRCETHREDRHKSWEP